MQTLQTLGKKSFKFECESESCDEPTPALKRPENLKDTFVEKNSPAESKVERFYYNLTVITDELGLLKNSNDLQYS